MIFQTYHTGGGNWSWHLQLNESNYVLVNPVCKDDHSEPDCSNVPSGDLDQVCMFGIFNDANDDHKIKVCTMADGLEWLGGEVAE